MHGIMVVEIDTVPPSLVSSFCSTKRIGGLKILAVKCQKKRQSLN